MLEVNNLSVVFGTGSQKVTAVNGVSFSLKDGQTAGLVGESGSGKTTIGRCVVKLQKPTCGQIHYQGRDIVPMTDREFLPLRKEIQMIFQDPYGSLNPRLSILEIIGEPLEIHFRTLSRSDREARVADLLLKVGLAPEAMKRRPHEFSGGQRQRIGIARALAVEPKLIVCDEPVSALDVSVQAQIVNLLQDLQEELGLTYLFIAHDLAVVEHISDHVLVMHRGQIVEAAPAEQIYEAPQHEYTKKLLASVPALG